jgi:hypothetical protein
MGGIAYVYDWQERSYDPPECHPGQQAYTFLIRILSTSFISVSIFSVCCYSRVSISMVTRLAVEASEGVPCHLAQLRATKLVIKSKHQLRPGLADLQFLARG